MRDVKLTIRNATLILVAALVMALITGIAPDRRDRADEIPLPRGWTLEELQARTDGRVARWQELCRRMDCSTLPLGYHTHRIGDHLYHFPTSATVQSQDPDRRGGLRVNWGGYVDGPATYVPGASQSPVRSYTDMGTLRVRECCRDLLWYFGRAQITLPVPDPDVPYDFTGGDLRLETVERALRFGREPTQTYAAYLDGPRQSYNEDFWIGGVGETGSRGFRQFGLVSKEPLFHGRHVGIVCTLPLCPHCPQECTIRMLHFLDDPPDTRPHMELQSLNVSREPLFTCSLDEVEVGCDPSPDIFDGVPQMLALLEDALEASEVYPLPDSRAP